MIAVQIGILVALVAIVALILIAFFMIRNYLRFLTNRMVDMQADIRQDMCTLRNHVRDEERSFAKRDLEEVHASLESTLCDFAALWLHTNGLSSSYLTVDLLDGELAINRDDFLSDLTIVIASRDNLDASIKAAADATARLNGENNE